MPTIEVSLTTLEKLAGRKLRSEDLKIVKAEAVCANKLELVDTNRPDLWSVEGIARAIKCYYKISGMPKIKVKASRKRIIVDKSVKQIRPFIAGLIAKRIKITEELLRDLVQLQEKLSEIYGRKRQKISIGIYPYDKIKWPVYYRAVPPKDVRFAPLEFKQVMNLYEILLEHPKGIEYGYIIRHHNLFPIFMDSQEQVLSFPPIINSNYLGKVEPGQQNIFVEVTGTDLRLVLTATNIFSQALYDRGAAIESVDVSYPWKTSYGSRFSTPLLFKSKMSFEKAEAERLLGLKLGSKKIATLLKQMQYDAAVKNKIVVAIPHFRADIMHPVDVVEDIAIAHGYERFEEINLTSAGHGRLKDKTLFESRLRAVMVGLGFQEMLSPILSNKTTLHERMSCELPTVEIENFFSESYSAVRSWLLPSLLGCLSKNLHVSYPQRVFELGECAIKEKQEARTLTKLAAVITDNRIGYDDISSCVSALLASFEIEHSLKRSRHPSFIHGRCADIISKGSIIGIVGELHPKVLNNWLLEKPCAAFELDADELFKPS